MEDMVISMEQHGGDFIQERVEREQLLIHAVGHVQIDDSR